MRKTVFRMASSTSQTLPALGNRRTSSELHLPVGERVTGMMLIVTIMERQAKLIDLAALATIHVRIDRWASLSRSSGSRAKRCLLHVSCSSRIRPLRLLTNILLSPVTKSCVIGFLLLAHFSVFAERQVVPFLPNSGDNPGIGFIRATNQGDEDASIFARAFEDDGTELGESVVSIKPRETVHVTVDELTQANALANVTVGIELGEQGWWLELVGDANVEMHPYVRWSEGLTTPISNLPYRIDRAIDVPNFIIGIAEEPFSRLRIVNPSSSDLVVSIYLRRSAIERVPLESISIGARGSTWITGEVAATPVESAEGLLAQERGTWDLDIEWEFEEASNLKPVVLHLMQAPDGTFTRIAGGPQNKFADTHSIPAFQNSSDGDSYSLLRVWNHANETGVASATIRDGDGSEIGPIELTINGVVTVFSLSDLQAAADELDASWPNDDFIEIEMRSDLALDVFPFSVRANGLHVPMDELAPTDRFATRVVNFETDSSETTESLLRINNRDSEEALVTVYGRARNGNISSDISFSLEPNGAKTITESELRNGATRINGRLGSSSSDWQLYVIADRRVSVMSLLRTSNGDLSNLSAAPNLVKRAFGAEYVFQQSVSHNVVQSNCINCHVVRGFAQNTRLVFVDSGTSDHRVRNRGAFAEFLAQYPDGVEWILGKVQGRNGHGGGRRLASDSDELRELERFLTLLAEEEGISTGICNRSAGMRDVILRNLDEEDCEDVSADDLRSIRALNTGPLSEIEADDLRGLTNLTWLTLCGDPRVTGAPRSSLDSLPADLLAHLPQLDALQITGCDVGEIPDGFFQDVTLSYLSTDAPLRKLPELPTFTSTTAHQAELAFRNLRFSELPDYAFAHKGLRNIEIADSESLSSIGAFSFAGLHSLEILSLTGTSLDTLPTRVFSNLNSLTQLQLANNQISNIPEELDWPSGLTLLNLNGNQFSRLPKGIFEGLEGLKDLRIEDSGPLTDEISSEAFDGLMSLESLQLANSGIDEIPKGLFNNLSSLKSIRLQDNNLDRLPDGIFNGLTSLQSIELDGNPGEPFELLFELNRTDGDLLRSGPSEIRLDSKLGFPFDGELGLSVHNGTVSHDNVSFSRGSTSSVTIDVVQSDSSDATQVVLGPLTITSDAVTTGLRAVVDQPIALFRSVDNLMPAPIEIIQPRKIQIGTASWEYAFGLCFKDVDDDALTYSAVAFESGIVDIESSTNGVMITPVAVGLTEIEVTAIDDSGLSVAQTFELTVEPESDQTSFQIHVDYTGPVAERLSRLMAEASSRWEGIITNDIADVPVVASSNCDDALDNYTGDIDDLRISVSTSTKPSNFTAWAWVDGIREESKLPFSGRIVFNLNDIDNRTDDDLRRTALHELAHTLGFTVSVWEEHDLIRNPSRIYGAGADTHFTGPRAIRAFDEAGGISYTERSKVPLENSGVSNSDSHWAFTELMDVSSTGGLSAITIEQFGDLGYVVDASKADEYTLPPAYTGSSAHHVLLQSTKNHVGSNVGVSRLELSPDVLLVPLKIVNKRGQTVRVKYLKREYDE